MNISNVVRYISTENLISHNNSRRNISGETVDLPRDNTARSETIDMRNISLNEINDLIKSGVGGLLDIVPANNNSIISGYIFEDVNSTKVDFLGQVEGHIKFQKSIGGDISRLENILGNLKKIDGMRFPSPVKEIV